MKAVLANKGEIACVLIRFSPELAQIVERKRIDSVEGAAQISRKIKKRLFLGSRCLLSVSALPRRRSFLSVPEGRSEKRYLFLARAASARKMRSSP